MEKKLAALLSFYKKSPYAKIWAAFFDQYSSYGRWVQKAFIVVDDGKEALALRLFLGIVAIPGVPVKISYRLLDNRWQELYPGVLLIDFLAAYFGKPLESNTAKSLRKAEEKQAFFDALIPQVSSLGKGWIKAVATQGNLFPREQKLYEQLDTKSTLSFKYIAEGIDMLPVKFMRLSVLAQRIAGDPHYFDAGTLEGDIFLNALAYLANIPIAMGILNRELDAEILLSYGLIRDDITTNVLCSGVVGCNFGQKCGWMLDAAKVGASQVYPLGEIIKYHGFRPIGGEDVFVVENQRVYSTLVDECWERHNKLPPVICSSGQFKFPVWQMLRRVVNENCRIHYSGDFAPEGILMAKSLSDRYPEHVRFWRLVVEDCLTAVPIDSTGVASLKQLDGANSFVLQSLCNALRKEKRAAYATLRLWDVETGW